MAVVDERLLELERAQASASEQASNFEERIDSLSKKIELLVAAMGEAQKTQWGPILTGIGILMALGSYAGSFYVRDLGRVEKIVDKLETRAVKQVDPKEYREDYKEIEKRLDKLESQESEHSAVISEFERLRNRVEGK